VLATSKIGIDEYDKVQTTCDRVFGFILFELFSIDVETYGAHIHLVCHERCTDLGLTSQTKQMFDKVQHTFSTYFFHSQNTLKKTQTNMKT
jgi:hypothetical protein